MIIANVFKSEAIPEAERLDLNQVAAEIQKKGRIVKILPDADAIVAAIAPAVAVRVMWWPSCRMAASVASMRSYRNACVESSGCPGNLAARFKTS